MAELGDYPSVQIAELRAADPNPDSELGEVAAMAASPDPVLKAEAWQRVIVDRSLPPTASIRVFPWFWRPGQDHLLEPFKDSYLERLPGFGEGGMLPAMYYTGPGMPMFGIDHDYLDRVEEATANSTPIVRNRALERTDLLRRMLRSRQIG